MQGSESGQAGVAAGELPASGIGVGFLDCTQISLHPMTLMQSWEGPCRVNAQPLLCESLNVDSGRSSLILMSGFQAQQ